MDLTHMKNEFAHLVLMEKGIHARWTPSLPQSRGDGVPSSLMMTSQRVGSQVILGGKTGSRSVEKIHISKGQINAQRKGRGGTSMIRPSMLGDEGKGE